MLDRQHSARTRTITVLGLLTLGGALVAAVPTTAAAATACSVEYAVSGQWQGGFQGAVVVHNTGDALDGWTLTFAFPDGQTVSQGWGGSWTTGGSPSVRNESYNGAVPTGGSVTLGFIGTWNNSANRPATGFTLNGVACGGSGGGVTTTTSRTTTTTRATPTTSTTSRTTTTTTTSRTTTTTTTTTNGGGTGTPPGQYPDPSRVTGSIGAHDPTVVKRPDGTYLVATTGRGIPLKTSRDRVAWTAAGSAFSSLPWTSAYTTGDVWAPDLSYHNGQYYLYYAASSFGSSNSGIFLATSPSGNAGTWTNRGLVIGTTSSSGYNAIDPDLVIDNQGKWWLALGSFWSGLKLISIDPSTGLRSGSALYSIAQRQTAGGAIEAADIWERNGTYYLFASFDLCCKGASSTYRIMVGRSSSITGPYVDRNGTAMTSGGGTQVLAGHGSIHGPGHSATLRDTDGDYLFYHWYTDSGGSQLGINRLGYDSAGWPYVY